MKKFIMNSGGKDSMSTCIIRYEKYGAGGGVDGVVMSEFMFSNKDNIPAEHPLMYKWKHEVAIPKLEEMGYKVYVVKSEYDYLSLFHKRIMRSKKEERIGMKWGFPIAKLCYLKRSCKINPLNSWCKKQGEFEKIVGYAYDETERIESMLKTPNMSSTLYEEKVLEQDTFDICRPYSLLAPTYESNTRDGCWFCPNASVEQMAKFAKKYPHYWTLLEELSKEDELASQYFRYDKTFEQVNQEIKTINNRMTIWDYLGE